MTSSITDYRILTREIGKTMNRLASEPDIKREIQYYKENVSKIKSVDDFLGNKRIYDFAMTAFGMKDLIYAKAMIRKVLTEGIDSPNSFAFSLSDQRFREFAGVFNFKAYASATMSFDRAQQGTVDRYLRNSLEERAGQSNESVRLALYFDRKAPELRTELGILADKAIYAVVRTALGLPDSLAATDIDKQAKLIGTRLNVADFSDPSKRSAFITRFLAMSEAKSDAASTSPLASLYSGGGARIEMNTLLSLQSIKRFGS